MKPNKFAISLGSAVFLALLLQSHFWISTYATSTYYADYLNGCDTNNGLAETQTSGSCPAGGTGPFQHAPGMKGLTPGNVSTGDGCSSNCAAVSPGAGTVIVLKGGVVWPNTVLPWIVPGNGTSSTQKYGCAGPGCLYVGNAIGAGLPSWNVGEVNSVTLTRDLCGWSSVTVSFTGGGGTGAAATASLIPPYSATPSPPTTQSDPDIVGCIYHITVTNRGSGYTSAPLVTISGTNSNGSGIWATAVADIDRPVIDAGGTLGSPPDWNIYSTSPQIIPFCPSTGNFSIIYGIECRNIMVQDTNSSAELAGFISVGTNSTITRSYVHGYFVDCAYPFGAPIAGPTCSTQLQTITSGAISVFYPYDEASYNTVENGDSLFVATSASQANNIGNVGQVNEMGAWGITTGTQGAHGPASVHNNWIYGGSWQIRFAGNSESGSSDPFLNYNNETWMTVYSVNRSAHQNRYYSQLIGSNTGGGSASILVVANDIDHNHVQGSGNQQQCQPGTIFYFFNDLMWAWGTSTPAFGINTVSPAVGGCTVYLVNSTLIDTFNNTSGLCINTNASATNAVTVVVQNLHCLSTSNISQFWSGGTNITFQNSAGSSVTANVLASSVMDTISNAAGEGYTLSNLYAPTANTNETVNPFTSSGGCANLASFASGQSYLAPLLFDLVNNSRPAVTCYQAGAYQFGTGVSLPAPAPTLFSRQVLKGILTR